MNKLKYLVTRSPLENYSVLKSKFKGVNWDYSEVILKSKKHMNHQYLIDRWERYLRVIKIKDCEYYKNLDFNKKDVLELGCGPFFGWGPIALFRGASMYYFHEPSLMLDLVRSDEAKERYFFPLYQELCSNYGNIMSFLKWYDSVMTKCIHIDFSIEEQVDLVLSNSVLEHLPRSKIEDIFSKLFFVCKSGGYFFHAVDFGAHGADGAEFGSMYTRQRKKDFQGLNPNGFDHNGNFTFGIKEHIIFPEINFDKVDRIRGMDITLCTTGDNKNISHALLKAMNFPFYKTKGKKGLN